MKDLIEAMQIFILYGNPHNPFHCEHDVLTVAYSNEGMTEEHIARLDELGFFYDEDTEDFKSYRFGSC